MYQDIFRFTTRIQAIFRAEVGVCTDSEETAVCAVLRFAHEVIENELIPVFTSVMNKEIRDMQINSTEYFSLPSLLQLVDVNNNSVNGSGNSASSESNTTSISPSISGSSSSSSDGAAGGNISPAEADVAARKISSVSQSAPVSLLQISSDSSGTIGRRGLESREPKETSYTVKEDLQRIALAARRCVETLQPFLNHWLGLFNHREFFVTILERLELGFASSATQVTDCGSVLAQY